jgi:Flp pilus assembly protein TadD
MRYRLPKTAVSVFALMLTACAGQGPSDADLAKAKSALLLQIADETDVTDPGTAASLYKELHDASPKDPVPLTRLGSTLMRLGDYRDAAEAYRELLALDPKNEDAHRSLALAMLLNNDADGALAEIRTALAKNPADPRLYALLGVAQDMGGHHDLAQQTYRHGLEIAPANLGLRNNLALSEALGGDYTAAVSELQGIAGPEAAPRYRLNLALAYGLAGDDAKAAAIAREVLDEPSVENNLANYALLRGMSESERTAAIIGSELHGTAIAFAPPAKPQPVAAATPAAAASETAKAAPAPLAVVSTPVPLIPVPGAPAPQAPPAQAAHATSPQSRAGTAESEITAEVSNSVSMQAPAAAPAPPTAAPAAKPSSGAAATVPAPAGEAVKGAPMPVADTSAPLPVAPFAAAPATQASPADAHAASPQSRAGTTTGDMTPQASNAIDAHASAVQAMQTSAAPAVAEPLRFVPIPIPAGGAPLPILPLSLTAAPQAPAAATSEVAAPISNALEADVSAMPAVQNITAPPAPDPQSAVAPLASLPEITVTASRDAGREEGHEADAGHEGYVVQLGSFLSEAGAHRLADWYAAQNVMMTVTPFTDAIGQQWYVVRAGFFDDADDARSMLRMIQSMGATQAILVRHHATA